MNDVDDDPSIEIRSCHGRRRLRFHSRRGDCFYASVEGDGPSASVRVWGYTDCHLLVDLFESIAQDRRGWQGERSWVSIEDEFRIGATTDKAGHVTLSVVLAHCDGMDNWRFSVPVFTEAGQLENIAREVASFFSSDANGPPPSGAA